LESKAGLSRQTRERAFSIALDEALQRLSQFLGLA
jgi:hypothetical protein